MSNVTNIAAVRHRETIGTLRHLLARAERGEIAGLNFVVEEAATGEKLTGYTGSFRADPSALADFIGRLAVRLCNFADAHRERVSGSDR